MVTFNIEGYKAWQHFDIYKFEFEKIKDKKKILFSKSHELFEIHWIIVLMEGAMSDAFQDEQ